MSEYFVIALNREYETGSFVFCGFELDNGYFKAFGTPQYLRLNDLKGKDLIKSLKKLIENDYENEEYTCSKRQLQLALKEIHREAA